ncbi:MAG TPA: bifunctional hydroxymethylpyrimidine kinase/phosphomethylpyrimidine kinase [Mucilaginibacter sp.]
MKQPHVLAIGSFAVHGVASLKAFTTILGEKILPVPSIMLNGLTNMSLVKKFDTPFRELLEGTLELAANRNLELIIYTGYLGKAEQADIIIEMVENYRSLVKLMITDPVCGDHGRIYVPQDVIEKWPQLISISDIVFPNLTELRLLTGNRPDADGEVETWAEKFKQLYPNAQLVVTSIKTGENAIGLRSFGAEPYNYSHMALSRSYGGSGDVFLAWFILYHFYKQYSFNEALKMAADQVYRIIENSIAIGSDDLILEDATKSIETNI